MQSSAKTSILFLSDGKPSDSVDARELPRKLEEALRALHSAVAASATFLEHFQLLGFGEADEQLLRQMASTYPANVAEASMVGREGYKALAQSVSTFASTVSVSRLSSVSATVDKKQRALRRIDRSLHERMYRYDECELFLVPERLGDFGSDLERVRGYHDLLVSSRLLGHGGERNAYLMRFVTPNRFTGPDEDWCAPASSALIHTPWVLIHISWALVHTSSALIQIPLLIHRVVKESRHERLEAEDDDFHRRALVTQHAAAELAKRFNEQAKGERLKGLPQVIM